MGFFEDWCDSWDSFVKQVQQALENGLKPIFQFLGMEDEQVYLIEMEVCRLMDDTAIPSISYLTTSIMRSIIEETSITKSVINAAISGPTVTLRQFVDYGEDTYYFGLPELVFQSPPIHLDGFADIVDEILADKSYTPVGTNETVTYCTLGAANLYDWGLAQIQYDETYNYTNSTLIGGNSYVYIGVEEAVSAEDPDLAVMVRYTVADTPIYEYIELPNKSELVFDAYYHYKNTVTNAGGETFYFVYLFAFNYNGPANAYPDMTQSGIHPNNEDLTKMLPVSILKQNNVYTTAVNTPLYYDTTKALLDKLGFDLDAIVTDLSEDANMNNVSDAFIICGLNLYSTSPNVQKYLYVYFDLLYRTMAVGSYDTFNDALPMQKGRQPYIIKITEQNYNVDIFFNYIKKEYVAGVLPDDELFNVSFSINSDVTVSETSNGSEMFAWVTSNTYNNSSIIFKRQLTNTTYEQITVHGLKLATIITAGDGTKHAKLVELVTPTGGDTTVINKRHCFCIPLSYAFLKIYGLKDLEKVLYESFNLVIFASQYETVVYYQTETFQRFLSDVLTIVAVIVMIYTRSSDAYWAVKMFIQMLLAKLFQDILRDTELSDPEAAFVIIAYLYLNYLTGGSGSKALDAVGLANIVLQGMSAVTTVITIRTDAQIESLEQERQEIENLAKTYEEQMQDIRDGLNSKGDLNLLNMTSRRNDRFEEPKKFYARTINRNSTKICTDYSSIYCEAMLNLDTIRIT